MSKRGFDWSVLRWVPIRLILVLITILGIALTALLAVSFERERALMEALGAGDGGIDNLPDQTRSLLLLLIASGTAITAAVIVQHYRDVRRELARTQSLSQNVLENLADGVLAFDASGRSQLINRAGRRLIGASHTDRVDIQRLSNNGGRRLGELVSEALSKESYARQVDLPSSGTNVPLEVSTFPLLDASGTRTGVIALLRDMSEVVSLETELKTADRLSSLGTLSAGIAHEIKNPLSAIDLNLRLLETEVAQGGDSAAARDYFEVVREEIDRLNRLVDNVLRFGKPTVALAAAVDVTDAVDRAIDLLIHSCRERSISLSKHYESEECWIVGDASSLQQAFMNILLNAIQSMEGPGTIDVRLRLTAEAGRRVCEITFVDSGRGIRSEDLDHVLDPFFSNKTGGTGLGLSIVHRIVADHRGTIRIESTVGRGTTVSVKLPMPEASR